MLKRYVDATLQIAALLNLPSKLLIAHCIRSLAVLASAARAYKQYVACLPGLCYLLNSKKPVLHIHFLQICPV
jgi:hypothetical protein